MARLHRGSAPLLQRAWAPPRGRARVRVGLCNGDWWVEMAILARTTAHLKARVGRATAITAGFCGAARRRMSCTGLQ
eukprot:CAMPEP_0205854074 /NCGR_PEP_ID=MMETSP1083-20121108/1890_1 /ASSEMBLY_ACC=CAM_ASM_000430 /TAXON_ID=97485 /ORGANISM="Prymnesium parvum, Strain Texoma1" /LENGTH=76 /DNA_ID=CAMNT_0053215383 /DNA_START=162 /DNA_END=392 /DNA_ORIENTATION=-